MGFRMGYEKRGMTITIYAEMIRTEILVVLDISMSITRRREVELYSQG